MASWLLAAAPHGWLDMALWQLDEVWQSGLQATTHRFGQLCLELRCVRPAVLLQVCNGGDKTRNGVNDSDPTGMQAWGLARTLSAFVVERQAAFEGASVLEFGCGQGMVGIVAAHFAAQVVLTDYEPSVLALASLNAAAAAESSLKQLQRPAPAVRRLVWTSNAGDPTDLGTTAEATGAGLGRFDVLLGSELLYHETDIDALLKTMERHLSPNGVSIMAFHVRLYGLVADLKAAALSENMALVFADIDSVAPSDLGAREARGTMGGNFFCILARDAERETALKPWLSGLTRVEVDDVHAGTETETAASGADPDDEDEGIFGLFAE